MTRQILHPFCALVLLLATSGLAHAEESNAPSRLDYTSFRIIAERNIFNPNRSGRSGRNLTRREPERRSRVESFALVGTLSYEKGQFAFFDGASSQYRKVLEADGTIAGYKVAEIAPNHVKLEATNGAAVELRVGMEMRRQDEGNWLPAARTESPSAASASSDEKTEASSGGAGDDVVRKLMQQREQELNKGRPAPVEQPAAAPETKTEVDSGAETNDVVRRLMQKREQERLK